MNPYRTIAKKENQRRPRSWSSLILFVVSVFLAPFAAPALLHFLPQPNPIPGMEGLAFRLSALVGAAVAMWSYQQIIRTPERAILGTHPIQPILWFYALFYKTIRSTWTWPCTISALAWPLASAGYVKEYILMCGIVVIGWVSMLCVSYSVHLGSVWVARSPQWGPMLDMIRGNNPREQAAFIYAPGFALFFCGMVMMLCSFSMDGVLQGYLPAIVLLLAPLGVAVASFFVARKLSMTQLVPASAVLAEVDARWAMLEEGQDEEGVYLEWLAGERRELVRTLRQGWRSVRVWPMGIWALGLFAFVSGWTGALENALLFSSVGSIGGCTIAVVLAQKNPIWLDQQLGVQGSELLWARFWVCFLYAQGAIIPILFFVWSRALFRLGVIELCVLACAFISSYLSVYHRKQGLMLFPPIALVFIFLGLL